MGRVSNLVLGEDPKPTSLDDRFRSLHTHDRFRALSGHWGNHLFGEVAFEKQEIAKVADKANLVSKKRVGNADAEHALRVNEAIVDFRKTMSEPITLYRQQGRGTFETSNQGSSVAGNIASATARFIDQMRQKGSTVKFDRQEFMQNPLDHRYESDSTRYYVAKAIHLASQAANEALFKDAKTDEDKDAIRATIYIINSDFRERAQVLTARHSLQDVATNINGILKKLCSNPGLKLIPTDEDLRSKKNLLVKSDKEDGNRAREFRRNARLFLPRQRKARAR